MYSCFMKSVKDLLENYTFVQAKKDLEELIEKDFKKDHINVPPIMVHCFCKNLPETKKFFSELEVLGYQVLFLPNSEMHIKISDAHQEELLTLLIDTGLDRLLDNKNMMNLLSQLVKNPASKWRAVPNTNAFEYDFTPLTENHEQGYLRVDLNDCYFRIHRHKDIRFELSSTECALLSFLFSKKIEMHTRDQLFKNYDLNPEEPTHISLEDHLSNQIKKELKRLKGVVV
jgi:hypothetical protein